MAKLIPTIDPSEIENPGERKIAIALIEQLPAKVEVFHSFQWISLKAHKIGRTEKLKYQQGECDFVVLNPEFGILFIEVKGGSLKYNPEEYQWFRENKGKLTTLNKDPFDQVRNNMYALLEHVKREYQQRFLKY